MENSHGRGWDGCINGKEKKVGKYARGERGKGKLKFKG
jgi:hypothetical protein